MINQTPSFQPSNHEELNSAAFDYKGWREQFIVTILRIACVLGVALIASSFPSATIPNRILFSSLYFIVLIVTVFRVNYSVRAFALLFTLFTVGVNTILARGPWNDGNAFFIAFITLSALLFDQRIDIVALLTSILTFVLIATLQQLGIYQFRAQNVPVTTLIDWVSYTIDFSIISTLLIVAINQLMREFTHISRGIQNTFETLSTERAQLEDRVRERTDEAETRSIQMRSSAAISKTITETHNVSELMETTARQISDQFGYYHVGLYLLDERKRNAVLQAASSGDQPVGNSFRIEPDRLNPINQVIERNRPHIVSDVHDANFMRGTNFLLTPSRMILPLSVRNNVIGFMDVHSENPQAFNTQTSEVLQTLADLTAISIDNARLINETENLADQLEANTSAQTRETWKKFTNHHKPAYQYTPAGVRPLFANSKQDNQDGLLVPLMLQGQRIGNITLKRKGSDIAWSERERILVEKVASQVALALENSRLVDETQKSAMRDQMIANVSARVRENLDIESVLRTATTELRKVFDLKEAEVSIGLSQSEIIPAKKHTSFLQLKSDKS
jgi:GAF domain-containing protein